MLNTYGLLQQDQKQNDEDSQKDTTFSPDYSEVRLSYWDPLSKELFYITFLRLMIGCFVYFEKIIGII
jgi:hypothetical protein